MAGRSPIFRNSDIGLRDLERRIASSRTADSAEIERLVAALFRVGRLSIPHEPGQVVNTTAPDTLGRMEGLTLSLSLGKTAAERPWRSSEDYHIEFEVENDSPLDAIVARRAKEKELGLPLGGSIEDLGRGERSVEVKVELNHGLPVAYYKHSLSMSNVPWSAYAVTHSLREVQATPEVAVRWLVKTVLEVAEHVARRERVYSDFIRRIKVDPRLEPAAAYDALMDYVDPTPSGGWKGTVELMELVAPPPNPRWRVQTPVASGYGYAWASVRHMEAVIGSLRGSVIEGRYRRDYGPFETESTVPIFVSNGIEITSTRARNTEHRLPVDVRYPTIMRQIDEHFGIPVEGRWTIGLGGGQPATVQAFYRPVIDVIRRDFPGAVIYLRDLGRYPTDYEGRRLESGYH